MITAERNALLLAKLKSYTAENVASPQAARAALKREGLLQGKPKSPPKAKRPA